MKVCTRIYIPPCSPIYFFTCSTWLMGDALSFKFIWELDWFFKSFESKDGVSRVFFSYDSHDIDGIERFDSICWNSFYWPTLLFHWFIVLDLLFILFNIQGFSYWKRRSSKDFAWKFWLHIVTLIMQYLIRRSNFSFFITRFYSWLAFTMI